MCVFTRARYGIYRYTAFGWQTNALWQAQLTRYKEKFVFYRYIFKFSWVFYFTGRNVFHTRCLKKQQCSTATMAKVLDLPLLQMVMPWGWFLPKKKCLVAKFKSSSRSRGSDICFWISYSVKVFQILARKSCIVCSRKSLLNMVTFFLISWSILGVTSVGSCESNLGCVFW